jgi:hypothetical protein
VKEVRIMLVSGVPIGRTRGQACAVASSAGDRRRRCVRSIRYWLRRGIAFRYASDTG